MTENRLAQKIAYLTGEHHRIDTAIPGLSLHNWPHPTDPTSYTMAPSICLIGQGRKRVFLGGDAYIYDAHRFLVSSVDLPVVSQILEASSDEPYLGLTYELDLKMLARMMFDNPNLAANISSAQQSNGISVSHIPEKLLDAVCRLIDLLDDPGDIPILAPLIQREIYFRLLKSSQGHRLKQLVSSDSHSHRISRTIEWLTQNYTKPLKVEDLADKAGLSTSAFHHHFKTITSMSPLQFQKKMRLNEARRLMLAEELDASTAAFSVGYESPSQFNREYKRQFGASPKQDVKALQVSILATE